MRVHAAALIAVMAVFTVLLRFLPFLLFRKKTPAFIAYLGEVLPAAIIGMLVVYCLKDVQPAQAPYAIPEALAVLATGGLQAWKRNSLASILGGTAIYMILIRVMG